jgi:hypothetical protein
MIYEDIYQGGYPFKEMLDPSYILGTFFNPCYFWRVFKTDEKAPEPNEIVGCATIVVDFEHRAGYLRGFNIRPKYQSKIAFREMAYGLIWQFLDATKGKVDKWYNESRTAHNITQFLSDFIGARSQAVLLNKDYFMGKKESDCLMAAYWSDAFTSRRIIPRSLIPEVMPYYQMIMDMHNHYEGMPEISVVNEKIDLHEVIRIASCSQTEIKTDEYGYITFRFEDPRTGDFMEGLHTPMVKNIEKIHYRHTDISSFVGLFHLLRKYARENNAEYFEFYIPASDTAVQQFILSQNLTILGYLPGWHIVDQNTLTAEDVVIFGWSTILPNPNQIKLVDDGIKLLGLIQCDQEIPSMGPSLALALEKI